MPLPSMMIVAAAAIANPERTSEYQSYRHCITDTVEAAAKTQVVPEDLLVQLHDACPNERAGFATMMRKRAQPKAGEERTEAEGAGDPDLVTPWTDRLLVRAIRRYAIHYTTGRWIRE